VGLSCCECWIFGACQGRTPGEPFSLAKRNESATWIRKSFVVVKSDWSRKLYRCRWISLPPRRHFALEPSKVPPLVQIRPLQREFLFSQQLACTLQPSKLTKRFATIKFPSQFNGRETHCVSLMPCKDGLEALRKARELLPDLVLLDISTPSLTGLEATRLLRQEVPRAKILVISQHDRIQLLPRVLEAGAHGCIDRTRLSTDLLASIRSVCRPPSAPRIAKKPLEDCPGLRRP